MTAKETTPPQPTRRMLLVGGLAVVCIPLVGDAALATPEEMAGAIRELTGGQPIKPGRVKLVLPELAENGNTVALSVTVASPMTQADYVKSISIFSEIN